MELLDRINSPADVKKLNNAELNILAEEIREYLIEVIAKTGGHLAPNLGVVELTLALHKVFTTPTDKIVWDVGHQSYVHKIITGRREEFKTLRQYGGLAGFPKRCESKHDAFDTGHSSTSISAALGMAVARDLHHEDHNVIAVIGDGALTGGMALEAINNAGVLQKKLLVILNDNEMSIAKNVGAMSEYLCRLRTDPSYSHLKSDVESLLKSIPTIGSHVAKTAKRIKDSLKYFLAPGMVFEQLGFTYIGPIDGHNIEYLEQILERAKTIEKPVLLHVITTKGKGYQPAENNPNKFHGTGAFDIATGGKNGTPTGIPTYTEIFGQTLVELAKEDESIVAITAAMKDGTGLKQFAETYPKRFFDVGIAEQHAVTMAAGMATAKLKPVVAIYSSFLQRAFDQVIHDVCMQKLPIVFCLDRAGLVGDDGYTHHGVYDISYLRLMPEMVIMAPKDENELRHMLYTALRLPGPVALRYPRGEGHGVKCTEKLEFLSLGKAEKLKEGSDLSIWAIGSMVYPAIEVAKVLQEKGVSVEVINMRYIKPLDEELLLETAKKTMRIMVLEENTIIGGAYDMVLETLNKHEKLEQVKVTNCGIPDSFVTHGKRELLLNEIKLDIQSIVKAAETFLNIDEDKNEKTAIRHVINRNRTF
ncbi:MAG TPA: 1-deoxy-D-xylulose-5-phosphate synthase [Candidatus Avacidaminococcus intestinavium]|uniref:1-deoxy-D-xylulose-5-phosphate synthase n=1 Tax=Candidatus Avacidaminococcus intestinavium TaxID=2840684 RepID=A0A9D1SL25_9FIRM|nr:1-deoxy-D-xylulose-5-phosphate synthase [Candidatus Avacidaminococcus intestinavium]